MSIKSLIRFGSIFILVISFFLFKCYFYFNTIKLIIFIILIILIIAFYAFIKISKHFKRAGYSEEWHDLYGDKILNIPYFNDDNKIINTFKKGEINYRNDIGEINEGKDYNKNNRNYYDLFIPYSAIKRKNKYNGIFLFIHGGGWKNLKKEYISHLTIRYAKYGYITAQMNHTFLNKKSKHCSIFRIMDEITSCLENIKLQLIKLGFDKNKLELVIGGISSGAHLSLLYGYSMKNSPFPIKYLINYCGPLSLENIFWYKLEKNTPALENIEKVDIEKLIKEGKIKKIFENELKLLEIMNLFIGNKFSDKDLKEMLNGTNININNNKFKDLNKIAKLCYPTTFINENSAPTLSIYGGIDSTVGILQYSHLKKLSEKLGNKVELIYMKNGGHLLDDYNSLEGMKAIREIHYKILNYAKIYFTSED